MSLQERSEFNISSSFNIIEKVIFDYCEFSGYVGETVTMVSAYILKVDLNTRKSIFKELNYNDLKSLYRYVKGKEKRTEYHCLMGYLSRAGLEREAESTKAQILSLIK